MTGITGRTSIVINAGTERVWQALTDPAEIKQYLFGTDTHTDWKKGSPIRFTGEWEGKKYEDKGTIREIEKPKLIKYDYWSSMSGLEDKPENYVMVSYVVTPLGDQKTQVEIVQENIRDEKSRDHSQENWKMVLEGLKKVAEAR